MINCNKCKYSKNSLEGLPCLQCNGVNRCPLRPLTNFSGCEEHLSEYRHVIKDIGEILK